MSSKIGEEGQEGPAHFKSEGKFSERAWRMANRRETRVPVGSKGRRLAWILIEMTAFKNETKRHRNTMGNTTLPQNTNERISGSFVSM